MKKGNRALACATEQGAARVSAVCAIEACLDEYRCSSQTQAAGMCIACVSEDFTFYSDYPAVQEAAQLTRTSMLASLLLPSLSPTHPLPRWV